MMKPSRHLTAILQALFVSFLWSTSWVLIKFTLQDIPPLIFAGLRYTLAAVFLLPGLIKNKAQVKAFSKKDWKQLILLGIIFYALAQGGMFLALNNLEAITLSLLLNFSAVVVALLSAFAVREIPTKLQWLGIVIFLGGVLVYFYPFTGMGGRWPGFVFAGVAVVSYSIATLMGRSINREKLAKPVVITGVSMGIGGVMMLGAGLAFEEFTGLTLTNLAVILWLAAVNTAFAFSLWNHSLQTLSAVEASLINNTMLIQIAVLAWIFLDETLIFADLIGLGIAALGVILAHLKPRRKPVLPET
jgi:drug/metabolite transporter (DMT)-like permease